MADSPSSQYSSGDMTDHVADPADSHGEVQQQQQPEDEEGFFDIDILIRKLEVYKASVEDAQAQLRRKRSINPREVSEATVAARLRLRLDGRPPASSESHDNSVLTSPTALTFPSSASSNTSNSSEISYFDPITPEDHEEVPVEAIAGNKRETWKSSHSVLIQGDKRPKYDVPPMPIVPIGSPRGLVRDTRTSRAPTIRLLSSKSTVNSLLGSPAFAPSDWPEMPRAIGSGTISEYGDGPRKSTDAMSMCPRDEDRIRREIETYTIKDWIKIEDVKQLEIIASSKEPGQVQVMPLGEEDFDLSRADAPVSQYECRKTTFREKMGSLWNRRTKADKIIELYFDMEATPKQKTVRTPK